MNHDLVIDDLEKDYRDLSFHCSGFDICKKSQIYGPRIRRYHLIHFVMRGNGTLLIDSERYPVHGNQAFYIPAGTSSVYQADFHTPWEYCWIGFRGTGAGDHCKLLFSDSYVIDLKDSAVYADFIMDMLSCTDDRIRPHTPFTEAHFPSSLVSDARTLPQHLFLNGMLKTMFAKLLLERNHAFDSVKTGDYAGQMKLYLEKHYHEHLLIGDVAGVFGLHPHYASELFKRKYRQTPKQFLTQLRIEKAKTLLADTEYPLRVIANAVGLENPFSFSRLFKSVTGISPEEYRKNRPVLPPN